MEEHKHVPRAIVAESDEHGQYTLGVCGCTNVVRISDWRREHTEGRFTGEWDATEPWRNPKEHEKGAAGGPERRPNEHSQEHTSAPYLSS